MLSDFWIVAKYNRMTTAGMFVYRCVMFYKIAKKINYCGQRPDSSIFTGLMGHGSWENHFLQKDINIQTHSYNKCETNKNPVILVTG